MIFDTNFVGESADLYSLDNVEESKYELGLNGALMHVYENECNYNALMRAVGLSELKYYNETGQSLFVHEAGAFKGFIEKAKAFFKKIIEKIKAIFKKFLATINSFTMKDKEFVKKYEKEILRKDITDLEFTGYEKLKKGFSNTGVVKIDTYTTADIYGGKKVFEDSSDVEDEIEKRRGAIIGKGSMSESEFTNELKDMLYGDKDTFDVDSSMVRAALETIKNTNSIVKQIEKTKNMIIKEVEDINKALDKAGTNFEKAASDLIKDNVGVTNKEADSVQKNVSDMITINKAISNSATVALGMASQAAKDANRQARALCVKVLGYKKKESYGESATDDLFGMVDFA